MLGSVALTGTVLAAAPKRRWLAMHQNTSAGSGLPQVTGRLGLVLIAKTSITNNLLDVFLKTDDPLSFAGCLHDLGLTVVQETLPE